MSAAHDLPGRDASSARPDGPLDVPRFQLAPLLETLGCKLFPRDVSLAQYTAWAWDAGLFALLERGDALTLDELAAGTSLNERGADALVGVLCAVGIVDRRPDGRYRISETAADYLSPSSPYCVGAELCQPRRPIPRPYTGGRISLRSRIKHKLMMRLPMYRFGSTPRLANQHARNLPACVAAAHGGEFDGVRCLVDVAGGSGAFSIPLALRYPDMRVVLTELPQAIDNVRGLLRRYGLEERIELFAMDAFEKPWPIPDCDGIFIGNLLHAFGDATCIAICREAFERLSPGGKLWLHEVVWNENRDGPLITAMWNASLQLVGGKQRTVAELQQILEEAGAASTYAVPTADGYALVAAEKPTPARSEG